LAGVCAFLLAGPGYGQGHADMEALIRETQRMAKTPTEANGQEVTLIWWVPVEFWEQSLDANPAASKQTVQKFKSTLDRYTLVIVLSAQIGPFGGMTYKSEEAVRGSVTLRDAQNTTYAPLADSQISPDAKNLMAMMKPLLANMLGPLGQNFTYLFFNAKTKTGRPLADPMSEGSFSAIVADHEFKFRLPLGSLLPPKFDPATHEQFPGNYLYSPFTGSKLVTEPAGDTPPAPPENNDVRPPPTDRSPVKPVVN